MSNKINRNEEENRLLLCYQAGDEDALKQLIRLTHPKMEKVILSSIRKKSAAEDLLQECWYAIIPQLKTLKIEISFQAWALSIAKRKAIDWIRAQQQQRKNNEWSDVEADESIQLDSQDTIYEKLKRIRVEIEQLPESQKIVLKLFYLENLSISEVSGVLGISEGTVKSRLFTARESLKKNVI